MKFVSYNDWSQLPESARALFEQAEGESLFFCRQWFECVAATALQADDNIVLACVLSGDKVMAILPLMESASNNIWYSLSHGFTPHYSLLLANGEQERILTCLARALSQLPLKGLLLQPVANDDSKLRVLQKCMTAAGFNCDYAFRHYNWVYRAQGQSYAQYMAARPAQLRNTISRKKRKLEREHGYEIRLF
ncbi:MAG: GNAT family N-acetyltransferase, partial [Gammaproteobacteria bacterium]|nr:GNAT family N-acetyltransferase [Gammaproteobacteria bacterium]